MKIKDHSSEIGCWMKKKTFFNIMRGNVTSPRDEKNDSRDQCNPKSSKIFNKSNLSSNTHHMRRRGKNDARSIAGLPHRKTTGKKFCFCAASCRNSTAQNLKSRNAITSEVPVAQRHLYHRYIIYIEKDWSGGIGRTLFYLC